MGRDGGWRQGEPATMINPSPPFMGRGASGASSTRDVTGEGHIRALAFPGPLAAERRIQQ